jgi:hypothetical protein
VDTLDRVVYGVVLVWYCTLWDRTPLVAFETVDETVDETVYFLIIGGFSDGHTAEGTRRVHQPQ